MVFVVRKLTNQALGAGVIGTVFLPLAPRLIKKPGRMMIPNLIMPYHDKWILESLPVMAAHPEIDFFILVAAPTNFRFLLDEYRVRSIPNVWIGHDWSNGEPHRADQTSLRLLGEHGWNTWYQVKPGKYPIDLNLREFAPDWALVAGREDERTFLRHLADVGRQLQVARVPFYFDGFGGNCSQIDYSAIDAKGKNWQDYAGTPKTLKSGKLPASKVYEPRMAIKSIAA